MGPRGILSRQHRTADAQADLSFDALRFAGCHSFLTNKYFCYGWIRVAIGIILGIERLPEQDSYDTENCYYYMFPFLCIELYNRNTHKKYLDCSSLEAAPTTYDASLFSLRKVSLFSFFH